MTLARIVSPTLCEPPHLVIRAYPQHVEPVLVNLLKNVREGIGARPCGHIAADAMPGRENLVKIVVSDNGEGVAADKLQDVFIPFYTSKKDGSGIGPSRSRQLVIVVQGGAE